MFVFLILKFLSFKKIVARFTPCHCCLYFYYHFVHLYMKTKQKNFFLVKQQIIIKI